MSPGPRWARALLALGLAGVLIGVAGCTTGPRGGEDGPFVELPPGAWPRLDDDLDLASLSAACRDGASYLEALPPETRLRFGDRERTAAQMASGMRRFLELVREHPTPEARRRALAAEFVLLRSTGRDGRGGVLFTGYFEPLLEARRRAAGAFRHPVYGLPTDLVQVDLGDFGVTAEPARLVGRVVDGRLLPYPTRADIDFGPGLDPATPVLGYLADPVELFFLHVQGSGTLIFPDGSRLRAGYAAGNGHPYRSVGRLLIDEGSVPAAEMSMQAIKAFLRSNPSQLERVLSFNPSYVFFRPLDAAAGGPLGCFGVPLTAGRAVATDRRLVPAPVAVWIEGTMPAAAGGRQGFSRFAVSLDTGSSIRGPGRVDLFIGAGEAAAAVAGAMQDPGRLYLLLPAAI